MNQSKKEIATFAGGCFWCMEPPFENVKGVESITVGYTGGHTVNPTYEDVCSGKSGHAEAIQVVFDPSVVSYEDLVRVFWHNIDPTTANKQFCDIGTQYRTAIFTHDENQKEVAENTKKELEQSGKFHVIATEIAPAGVFYPAEEYHQKYHSKNPVRYGLYHHGSGRDSTLRKIWGKE